MQWAPYHPISSTLSYDAAKRGQVVGGATMHRRTFCKTTLAAAVAATIPACGRDIGSAATDIGAQVPAVSLTGDEISIESAAIRELADGFVRPAVSAGR